MLKEADRALKEGKGDPVCFPGARVTMPLFPRVMCFPQLEESVPDKLHHAPDFHFLLYKISVHSMTLITPFRRCHLGFRKASLQRLETCHLLFLLPWHFYQRRCTRTHCPYQVHHTSSPYWYNSLILKVRVFMDLQMFGLVFLLVITNPIQDRTKVTISFMRSQGSNGVKGNPLKGLIQCPGVRKGAFDMTSLSLIIHWCCRC